MDQPCKKLETPRAAAPKIPMAPSTLYWMIKKGMVPSYQVGKTGVRVVVEEVIEALRRPVQCEEEQIPA